MMDGDTLRSGEVLERYKKHRKSLGAGLKVVDLASLPSILEWKFWRMVANEFPYDKIAERHCMLIPDRKFALEQDMTLEERIDLNDIKAYFQKTQEFDCIMENIMHMRTVPGHYHLHVLKLKPRTPVSALS